MCNPTWKKVVDALRYGAYDSLADEIECDLTKENIAS